VLSEVLPAVVASVVALPEEWAHQFACWAAQRLRGLYPG